MVKCEEKVKFPPPGQNILVQATYFPSYEFSFEVSRLFSRRSWPLVCLPPPPLCAAALLALIISNLRYLVWGLCVFVCMCMFTGTHSTGCAYICFLGLSLCWEGRYVKRFYNRADTVSRFASLSPQGILPVLRRRVVGVRGARGERATEERVYWYKLNQSDLLGHMYLDWAERKTG